MSDKMVMKRNQNLCKMKKRNTMSEIFNFINEKMKVLLVISENSMEIDGIKVCPLNQQEIANQVPCGKPKVNQIIRELTEEGYVETLIRMWKNCLIRLFHRCTRINFKSLYSEWIMLMQIIELRY